MSGLDGRLIFLSKEEDRKVVPCEQVAVEQILVEMVKVKLMILNQN
jgi:hypothetical protein